jgi:hypothetical protein
MKRQELTAAIALVEPVINTSLGLQPIYRCVNFDGKLITATDGTVTIAAPFATDFTGAVEGKRLYQWLLPSAGKSVEVEDDKKGGLLFKAGRAKLNLPRSGTDTFPISLAGATFKGSKPKAHASSFDELGPALAFICAFSGVDSTMEWSQGITWLFTEDGVEIFSTDNVTLARVRVAAKVSKALQGQSFITPLNFLSIVLRLLKTGEIKHLWPSQDQVSVQLTSGALIRSALLADKARPEEYQDRLAAFDSCECVKIPPALADALKRQQAVSSGVMAPASVFSVSGGVLRIKTNTTDCHSAEALKLEGHPDVKFMGDPASIVRPLGHVGGIFFTENAAVLRSNRVDFLVCALGEEEVE